MNLGTGPAIIRRANFVKDANQSTRVVDLFDLPVVWDTFAPLQPKRAIPPQAHVALVKLTMEGLLGQGRTPEEASTPLQEWRRQKTGIEVAIEYEDILGNGMEVYREVLS
jgi:hypothetical protein